MLCATAVMVEFLFEMLYRCEFSCTLLVLAGDVLLIECGYSHEENEAHQEFRLFFREI